MVCNNRTCSYTTCFIYGFTSSYTTWLNCGYKIIFVFNLQSYFFFGNWYLSFFFLISKTVSETVESVWHINERLFKSYDETLSPSIYLSYKNSKSITSELMQNVRSSLLWICCFVLKVNYIQDHRTQKTMLPIEIPF